LIDGIEGLEELLVIVRVDFDGVQYFLRIITILHSIASTVDQTE
jgi:hypothetical protein